MLQTFCCQPHHFPPLRALQRTLHPGTTHRAAGINERNTPRCPCAPRQHQTGEARDEADTPRGEALILGNDRVTSPTAAGSSRPAEGAVVAGGGVREELPRQDQEEPAHYRKEDDEKGEGGTAGGGEGKKRLETGTDGKGGVKEGVMVEEVGEKKD